MEHKTEPRRISGISEESACTAPKRGFAGAVRDRMKDFRDTVSRWFGINTPGTERNETRRPNPVPAAVTAALKTAAAGIFFLLIGWLFSETPLGFGTKPMGLALLCAAEGFLPAVLLGTLVSAVRAGAEGGLYFGAVLLAVGGRYAVGRFLTAAPADADDIPGWHGTGVIRASAVPERHDAADAGSAPDPYALAAWFRRAVLPPGVFAQTAGMRVGISLACAAAAALGRALGDRASGADPTETVLRALFFLCAVPGFTYLFCGVCGGKRNVPPALREGGICAFCYALTASMGGRLLFGLSLRLICAHALTLYLSKKGGFLRGCAAGLACGAACDVLYAPGYALIGAVSGVLWQLHPAPAVVLSLCAGAAYAVYAGAFAAVRSVVPEMIVTSAAAYPVLRYLPVPDFFFGGRNVPPRGGTSPGTHSPDEDGVRRVRELPPEVLGIPDPAEQLDALSGILGGLSATFYHLSDRGKKPGLHEIRQLCETAADRYCANCPHHTLCWEEDFSSTADAMGRITLCVYRKGRAEMSHAFAPLDTRCPSLPSMLAAISEAAAVLCEEKQTKDKTETAAADYEGMAKLLRAHAEEAAQAAEEDPVLSRRLAGAMERLGFRAEHVAVFGARRRTVVASGIDLGLQGVSGLRAAAGAENAGIFSPRAGGRGGRAEGRGGRAGGRGGCTGGRGGRTGGRGGRAEDHGGHSGHGRRGGSRGGVFSPYPDGLLLGTEDLRAAFSALMGVSYGAPEYALTAGGEQLCMTLRAEPQIALSCGFWGEKKPGEEVTGDAFAVFANRNDFFYALLCDGMGSGKEASVTAQIASLFLEKLLSVSTAKGAALNLLNTFLRSRGGECSATVDLCEIDTVTSEAHMLKCGAAASYLLRGEHLFRITSETMPLGILREVTAEETAFPLEPGDLLLFFSDGVCGECEDSSWIPKTVRAALTRAGYEQRWQKESGGTPEAPGDSRESGHSPESGEAGRSPGTKCSPGTGRSPGTECSPGFGECIYTGESGLLNRAAALLGEAAAERCGKNDDRTVMILEVRK